MCARSIRYLILLVGLVVMFLPMATVAAAESIPIYFGTYTPATGGGIHRAEFNAETGFLSEATLVAEARNPGFLAAHPRFTVLYAISEVAADGGTIPALMAWRLGDDGTLTELGRVPSGGNGPCHVDVSGDGRFAAVANYSSGDICLIPLDDEGRPQLSPEAAVVVRNRGGSQVVPDRQEAAHAHCVRFSPHGDFLLAADLGLDRVFVYRIQANPLALTETEAMATAPGAGPRHLAFTADGAFVLVMNELNSTCAAYRFQESKGELEFTSAASSLPPDYVANNTTAEVRTHPNGRWVYGSNRGQDSIATFELDSATGRLKLIGTTSAGVRTPRNFNLVAGGHWMLVAGQDSGTVAVFRVDQTTGLPIATGQSIAVPRPVCVLPWAVAVAR